MRAGTFVILVTEKNSTKRVMTTTIKVIEVR